MDKNVIRQDHLIDQQQRIARNGYKPLLIWFTGLSGSGKSTLASGVERELFNRNHNTYILDGDNIRLGLNSDLGFSADDRTENIRRISEVGKLFLDAGVVVLTAFISPFEKDRTAARTIVGKDQFVEVFVNCPIEECERRDVKGLYEKARRGEIRNFTGIDSPFEAPESPDIMIETHKTTVQDAVSAILDVLDNKYWNKQNV